ncbi:MAG: hypothetical protein KGQ57_10730 [Burkholderiales bacterium]|nr:hypothetical protein [Burkholderiales bacterium]
MRTIDQTHGEFRYDGLDEHWGDEPPLTEAELRQQREVEQDARLIQRLFE